jgi:mannose-6-phosphate isomerase-like protein (cupin superfamily)
MSQHDKRYDIETDTVMFQPAEAFDVSAVGAAQTPWWNRTLCEVNDSWVRLGVMEGDFHWHKHDRESEFFLVLEGLLEIELESRTVRLAPGQAFTVPPGAMHRTRARGRSVVLMIEKAGVKPTGD